MPIHGADRAAAHWGDARRVAHYAAGGITWQDIGAVRRRLNAKVSGDPNRDWIDHLLHTHLADRAPVARCLSLCCGEGRVERALAERGGFARCLGVDASAEALASAKQLASEAGIDTIEYRCDDVNAIQLDEGRFDLILAHHSLHHLEAINAVLAQVARGLRPDGLFACVDYVGPDRFQYSERRYELMDEALLTLPESYRRSVSFARSGRVGAGGRRAAGMWLKLIWRKFTDGSLWSAIATRAKLTKARASGRALVKERVPRISGAAMAIDDPSEAIRSSEVLPLLRETLDVVEEKPLGGAILMWVLDDLAGNFSPDDPEAEELLTTLFEREDALMAAGDVPSDFVYEIGRAHV